MNKKKLPKAVLRTAEQMREAARSVAVKAALDNVIEMVPKAEAPASAAQAKPSDLDEKKLRRMAMAVVERYANYSAISGAIPVPLANATAITALLLRMVKRLSDIYGIPFERNRTRAVIVGLMGGVLPTGFATVATSTLSYFVPGLNVMGLAVSAVTSGAYARSIGQLYIEHFENGSTPDLRAVVRH